MMFPEEESKLLLADRALVDLWVWLPWRRHDVADSALRGGAWRWERRECDVAGSVSALVGVKSRWGAQVDGGVSRGAWGQVWIIAPFFSGGQTTLAIG
jgi:hypothetical protein